MEGDAALAWLISKVKKKSKNSMSSRLTLVTGSASREIKWNSMWQKMLLTNFARVSLSLESTELGDDKKLAANNMHLIMQ